MGLKYKIVTGIQSETDKDKKFWHKIGFVCTTKAGGLFGRIELEPRGWDGTFSLFEPDAKEEIKEIN